MKLSLKYLQKLKKEIQSGYKMRIDIGSFTMTLKHSFRAHTPCHLRMSSDSKLNVFVIHMEKFIF